MLASGKLAYYRYLPISMFRILKINIQHDVPSRKKERTDGTNKKSLKPNCRLTIKERGVYYVLYYIF